MSGTEDTLAEYDKAMGRKVVVEKIKKAADAAATSGFTKDLREIQAQEARRREEELNALTGFSIDLRNLQKQEKS